MLPIIEQLNSYNSDSYDAIPLAGIAFEDDCVFNEKEEEFTSEYFEHSSTIEVFESDMFLLPIEEELTLDEYLELIALMKGDLKEVPDNKNYNCERASITSAPLAVLRLMRILTKSEPVSITNEVTVVNINVFSFPDCNTYKYVIHDNKAYLLGEA